jgi:uncharacterized membrane protein
MFYFLLKMVHIIGAAVLLGTGAGIAFFMLVAHLRGDPREIAGVARTVVLADFLFTASAVLLQPITGTWLAWSSGYSLRDGWIAASIALYLVTGAFWLPVVWMQMRMRDLVVHAVETNAKPPAKYQRLFRWWFAFGFPAFAAVLVIFWLMIARPPIPYWDEHGLVKSGDESELNLPDRDAAQFRTTVLTRNEEWLPRVPRPNMLSICQPLQAPFERPSRENISLLYLHCRGARGRGAPCGRKQRA